MLRRCCWVLFLAILLFLLASPAKAMHQVTVCDSNTTCSTDSTGYRCDTTVTCWNLWVLDPWDWTPWPPPPPPAPPPSIGPPPPPPPPTIGPCQTSNFSWGSCYQQACTRVDCYTCCDELNPCVFANCILDQEAAAERRACKGICDANIPS